MRTRRGGLSLVEIEWRDSLDGPTDPSWYALSDAHAQVCHDRLWSVGYLLKEDATYVWLVDKVHCSGQVDSVRVGQPHLIPKGCIVRRRRL